MSPRLSLCIVVRIAAVALAMPGCSTERGSGTVDELTWVENAGARMPVVYRGPASSDVVLLVAHGGPGGSAVEMIGAFEKLFATHLVAFWDQRFAGYSDSSRASPDTGVIAQYGEDAAAVITAVKVRWPGRRVVIWGASWGGSVVSALITSPEHQQLYDGWIIVNGVPDGYDNTVAQLAFGKRRAKQLIEAGDASWRPVLEELESLRFERERFLVDDYVRVGQIAEELTVPGEPEDDPALLERWLDMALAYFPSMADAQRLEDNASSPVNEDLFVRQLYNFQPSYDAIARPGLLIWGVNDETCPIEAARTLTTRLAAANVAHTLREYDDSWHAPWVDQLDRHASDVAAFLDDLAD